jgi:cysteinyl-tRNA synthetase
LAHIGNARPVVVFDILFRVLQSLYSRVTYVRNITDVDDKINDAAVKRSLPIEEITSHTIQAYHEDMAHLGTLPPTHEPRATHHIDTMISLIQTLIEKEHAYVAEGHVLFSVSQFPAYGALSRRSQKDMIAGARVEVAPFKKDPADFVLWKPSSPTLPGWESPWGRGRPGWHIECSAMSAVYLGESFDIHGGGQDLIFPHHENEIAQSTCAHGTSALAHYWMHNGWVTVDGKKMSKSLGNFITVRQLLSQAPGEVIRYALMMSHYRQPLDWTAQSLIQGKSSLDRLYSALRHGQEQGVDLSLEEKGETPSSVLAPLLEDLNIPLALAHLHDLATHIHKTTTQETLEPLIRDLKKGGALLGILSQSPQEWFQGKSSSGGSSTGPTDEEVNALIAQRQEARHRKDFAQSDALRSYLEEQGIWVEDSPQGPRWRRIHPSG